MDSRLPPDLSRTLVLRFLQQQRRDPALAPKGFLSAHPGAPPGLESLLQEALGWAPGEVETRLAEHPRLQVASAPDATIQDPLAVDRTLSSNSGASGSPTEDKAAGSRTLADEGETAADTLSEETAAPSTVIDNRYEVVRTLGEGGFGRVYLVRDRNFGGELRALKLILPQHAQRPEFAERFRNEIRIERAMTHRYIPRIHNDGFAENSYYYTMDFVEGVPLTYVLRREAPLRPERIVRLVRQIIEALDYAHAKGVIHRDLKPGNILLIRPGQPDEEVRILDFGIAKVLHPSAELQGAEAMNTLGGIGTPHYMSPEQVRGRDVDERTDIYALGIIVYQMCSGLLPFSGETDLEVATARLEQEPSPLAADKTPPWLRALVMQLLEREKKKRPTTKEVHERLDQLSAGQYGLRRSQMLIAAGLLVVAVGVGWLILGPKRGSGRSDTTDAFAHDKVSGGDAPAPNQPPDQPDVDVRPPFIECKPEHTVLGQPGMLLKGRIYDAPPGEVASATVTVGDGAPAPLLLDESGNFSKELLFAVEGPNSVSIEALDRAGNPAPAWTGTFVLDTHAPQIKLDALVPETTEEPQLALSGQVIDTSRCKLSLIVGDATPEGVELDAQNRFNVVLKLPEQQRYSWSLQATDGADNRSEVLRLEARRVRPVLRIMDLEPADASEVPASTERVTIRVSTNLSAKRVTINDQDAKPSADVANEFTLSAELQPGPNELHVVPYDQDLGAGPESVLHITRKPLLIPSGFSRLSEGSIDGEGRPQFVRHERTGIEFVLVKGGPTGDLYVGRYEVTRGEYAKGGGENAAQKGTEDKLPQVNVSFQQAEAFGSKNGLRLLKESEWLYAGRGTSQRLYPWGDPWEPGRCQSGELATTPRAAVAVDAFQEDKSELEVVGLAGNVTEWCTSDADPAKPALRGGAYSSSKEWCRLDKVRPVSITAADYVGFRVCVEAKSK